ncbi:hypothetical protein AB6A40_011037 [Gnathostoma spinigerum]|uniref:Glycerol-3-phosphate dehydrogenase NAD-dependent N-terminal domain-containing protein n=1 Tax=Gnathostoma spinigerum TaxID=75299 RepID=A0ABD6F2U8_9BILA
MAPRKVTIVGSGNWGSAVATVIGVTTTKFPMEFDSMVKMWVFEEMVDGRKLTEIINTEHENVKYLPGKKLPTNVVAVPDLIEACKDADVLIFVIPHQFIENVCKQLVGKLKADAIAVTLVKGLLARKEGHRLFLVSEEIKELLGIPVSVLMGANLAGEVANQNFCEATIGLCFPSLNMSSGLLQKFPRKAY